MSKYIDLHIHSNNSDGDLSVFEIVERAKKMDLSVISITDHDDVRSVSDVKKCDIGNMEFIPGVELSSKINIYGKERNIDILGYGINDMDECLNSIVEKQKDIRYNFNKMYLVNMIREFPFLDDDLLDLYSMLEELQFDSWSLIPIRGNSSVWKKEELLHYKEIYQKFKEKQMVTTKPELLGYSSLFAGRNNEEVDKTFLEGFRIVPIDKCNLVDLVRFYIPDKKLIVPCNCAAHRIHQIDVEYNNVVEPMEKASLMADWLRENGPSNCTGCEPLNAYLADNPLILKKSLFKY